MFRRWPRESGRHSGCSEGRGRVPVDDTPCAGAARAPGPAAARLGSCCWHCCPPRQWGPPATVPPFPPRDGAQSTGTGARDAAHAEPKWRAGCGGPVGWTPAAHAARARGHRRGSPSGRSLPRGAPSHPPPPGLPPPHHRRSPRVTTAALVAWSGPPLSPPFQPGRPPPPAS
ncbi:hypothetical protein I4F81_007763 [Pyropia yezoensis]|uniref:Uncharacterized protein n=1 Tax=Pyropia yezoensis TaxID=2788 RepID=A0ACC3C534_PYRYE|nr:hypothetical protein I4F81_007763 [Neopyropia yezoensis]